MFFINHNKEVTMEIVETHIKKIDEKINLKILDEESLHETIQLLSENMWIYTYDTSYIDILFEYVEQGLQMNPKGFKKKKKIMQATILKLNNMYNV